MKIKKQDLPRLRRLLRKDSSGVHQYPFTRGTGNYLNTLLDASLLEPEQDWLTHASRVIRATLRPSDDIEQRHLLVIESGWSYLVLLTSLVRYLWLKLEREELDQDYQYTLACLRHYWRWMVRHERPFLHQVPELEFPNHTWVAQDIRKAMLMFLASEFDPEWRNTYLDKAREWLNYVTSTLAAGEEKYFTRILIILLQNYGPHQFRAQLPSEALAIPARAVPTIAVGRARALATVCGEVLIRLLHGLATFRPDRERAWLKRRMES